MLPPYLLMGYSMGGPVSIVLIAARPDLIDGLILASPMLQINTGSFQSSLIVEFVCKIDVFYRKVRGLCLGGRAV